MEGRGRGPATRPRRTLGRPPGPNVGTLVDVRRLRVRFRPADCRRAVQADRGRGNRTAGDDLACRWRRGNRRAGEVSSPGFTHRRVNDGDCSVPLRRRVVHARRPVQFRRPFHPVRLRRCRPAPRRRCAAPGGIGIAFDGRGVPGGTRFVLGDAVHLVVAGSRLRTVAGHGRDAVAQSFPSSSPENQDIEGRSRTPTPDRPRRTFRRESLAMVLRAGWITVRKLA